MPNEHSSQFSFQPPTPGRLRLFRFAQAGGVPTIGPLFLANFIGATVFGLVLLVPMRRGAGRVWMLLDSLGVFLACIVGWTPRLGRQKPTKTRASGPSATPTASES
jgi:hypothetical protein